MLIIIITKEVNVSGPLHQLSSSGPSSVAVQGNVPAPDQARAGQINNTRQRAATKLTSLSFHPWKNTEYGEQTIYTNNLLTKYTYFNLMHPLHWKYLCISNSFKYVWAVVSLKGEMVDVNVGVCHLAWTWHQLSFESLDNSGSRTLHYITILSRAWWYLTWRRTAGRWGTLPSACRSWCRCTCGRTPASRSQSEDANQG